MQPKTTPAMHGGSFLPCRSRAGPAMGPCPPQGCGLGAGRTWVEMWGCPLGEGWEGFKQRLNQKSLAVSDWGS